MIIFSSSGPSITAWVAIAWTVTVGAVSGDSEIGLSIVLGVEKRVDNVLGDGVAYEDLVPIHVAITVLVAFAAHFVDNSATKANSIAFFWDS